MKWLWNAPLLRSAKYTPRDSATAAAECLVDIGLFESYNQFSDTCDTAGCDPEDIKANTFTFDKGSTQTDIAKEVTE